jgi:pimeloyl-ACP methyl ester carboxylesterase
LWRTAQAFAYFARHYDYRAMRAARRTFDRGPGDVSRLGEIVHPVLSVSGSRDNFCPGTRLLAERIPDCRRVVIPGPGHISTVRDSRFKAAVAAFFAETPSRFAEPQVK